MYGKDKKKKKKVIIFIIIIDIRISLLMYILINIINFKINEQLLISLTQSHKQKYVTNYYKAVKWAGLCYALLVLFSLCSSGFSVSVLCPCECGNVKVLGYLVALVNA